MVLNYGHLAVHTLSHYLSCMTKMYTIPLVLINKLSIEVQRLLLPFHKTMAVMIQPYFSRAMGDSMTLAALG
jgi:hypothetical protein